MSALWGHVLLWLRGCGHPKMELVGSYFADIDGEKVTVFIHSCTVCGITIVSTT